MNPLAQLGPTPHRDLPPRRPRLGAFSEDARLHRGWSIRGQFTPVEDTSLPL